jgi:hypothetical protein
MVVCGGRSAARGNQAARAATHRRSGRGAGDHRRGDTPASYQACRRGTCRAGDRAARRWPAGANLAPHLLRPWPLSGYACGTDAAADRGGPIRAGRCGAGPSHRGAQGADGAGLWRGSSGGRHPRRAHFAAGGTSFARGLHGGVAGGCRGLPAGGKPLSDLRRSLGVSGILPCRTERFPCGTRTRRFDRQGRPHPRGCTTLRVPHRPEHSRSGDPT